MKRIRIFDNGGETFDRYTLIDTKNGEVFGASSNPFSPLGFGQYCGNIVELSEPQWKKTCPHIMDSQTGQFKKYAIVQCLRGWKKDTRDKEVSVDLVPDPVKQYAKWIITEG